MAREEHDREDLLREAKALVERVSLTLGDSDIEVVIGFRRDGSASFFLGASPVYQFTSTGHLRRAYADDRLYKADAGRLVALRRERTADAVELIRHDLTAQETTQFLSEGQARLADLRRALDAGNYTLLGQVPQDSDVIARVRAWLAALPANWQVASSPRAS